MANFVQGPSDGISTDNAVVRWDGTNGRLVQNSVNGPFALDSGLLGLATTAPTHSLTLSSTATGIAVYNTADQTTNYERVRIAWTANICDIISEQGGTGTLRALRFGNSTTNFQVGSSAGIFSLTGTASGQAIFGVTNGAAGITLRGNITTTAGPSTQLTNNASYTGSSATQVIAAVVGTMNQSGTAAYKGLQVNVTETATGSGQKDLLSLEVGGTQRARVGQNGNLYSSMQVAIPAGGAANTGLFVSSTANFGVYYGSGAPTVSAAKGSLYLRSDGSGTNDRCYINTDGGTTWTAVVTVA